MQFQARDDLPALPGLEVAFDITSACTRFTETPQDLVDPDVGVSQRLDLSQPVEVNPVVMSGTTSTMRWCQQSFRHEVPDAPHRDTGKLGELVNCHR